MSRHGEQVSRYCFQREKNETFVKVNERLEVISLSNAGRSLNREKSTNLVNNSIRFSKILSISAANIAALAE